jgi:hypothetical protein
MPATSFGSPNGLLGSQRAVNASVADASMSGASIGVFPTFPQEALNDTHMAPHPKTIRISPSYTTAHRRHVGMACFAALGTACRLGDLPPITPGHFVPPGFRGSIAPS